MIRGLLALYSWNYPKALTAMLQRSGYRAVPFIQMYWRTQDFSTETSKYVGTLTAARVRLAVTVGMILQIGLGIALLILWVYAHLVAGNLFGLALLLSYPVIWAHLLALAAGLRTLLKLARRPKKLGRAIVCHILESQVRKLLARNKVTIVAVVGSVGKTSTKMAVAKVLESNFRVRYQEGNYNDRVTVPLVFFDQHEPQLFNVAAWLRVFQQNARRIRREYPYDVVVVELGTYGPGFMAEFDYLPVDIAVVTAIAEEHMEYFGTLDAVAAEELAIFNFSERVIVNGDNIPGHYLAGRHFKEYSLITDKADYYAKLKSTGLDGQKLSLRLANRRTVQTTTAYVGEPGAYFTLAAAAVADQLDMEASEIIKAIKKLEPFAGRMQVLKGIKNSMLIDDTYNASPVAVKAALDMLYIAKTKQRIAILGTMNELGDFSKSAHQEIGAYCDPKKLDLVVTIGSDANNYLAATAKKHGCTVKTFTSPYEAGEFITKHVKDGAVVLAKGSQNGVFAEEAVKLLLADKSDAAKLVRQSASWLKQKQQQFNG